MRGGGGDRPLPMVHHTPTWQGVASYRREAGVELELKPVVETSGREGVTK